MDCRDIQKRLSAYLDGLLSADEQETVDRHLSSCAHCGEFFGDLEKARRLLRELGDVEPPPFLSQKIMARVREEAVQKESSWRKLFDPFPLRVSAQAIGVLVLAVLGFHLYRMMEPEIGMTPQSSRPVPRAEKALPKPAAPDAGFSTETTVAQNWREGDERAATKDKGAATDSELRQAAPAGAVPAAEKPQGLRQDTRSQSGGEKSSAVRAPEQAGALHQPQSQGAEVKPGKESISVFGKEEKEQVRTPAPSGAVASGVAREPALPRIALTSSDILTARKAVREMVIDLGGKTIETTDQEGSAVIIVEVAALKFAALSERVGKLGEVQSVSQGSVLAEGPLRVCIEILPKEGEVKGK